MIVRAPGKLILYGEYALLEGHQGLVVAVNRHATTQWQETEGLAVHAPGHGRYVPAENVDELPFISELLHGSSTTQGHFLLESDDFRTTEGKLGLGSSAAATVSFAGMLHHLGTDELQRAAVFRAAQNAHRAVQGMGSGADVAASCFGGALRYAWHESPVKPHSNFGESITTTDGIACIEELGGGLKKLLTVWTGASASTTDLVAAVNSARKIHDAEYRAAIDVLADAAAAGLQGWQDHDRATLIEAMEQTVRGLDALSALGQIELVTATHRQLMDIVGSDGAVKPTGAGGGDLAWVVGKSPKMDGILKERLRTAGYQCFEFVIDTVGVGAIP